MYRRKDGERFETWLTHGELMGLDDVDGFSLLDRLFNEVECKPLPPRKRKRKRKRKKPDRFVEDERSSAQLPRDLRNKLRNKLN